MIKLNDQNLLRVLADVKTHQTTQDNRHNIPATPKKIPFPRSTRKPSHQTGYTTLNSIRNRLRDWFLEGFQGIEYVEYKLERVIMIFLVEL